MTRTSPVLLLVLVLLPGLTVAGQSPDEEELAARLRDAEQRMQEAAGELADLNLQMHGDDIRRVFKVVRDSDPQRAMLGINIGRIEKPRTDGAVEPDRESTDGVTVLGVTPGGPADAAGLQAGDVILQLNGERLAGQNEPSMRRLQDLMADVEPGATVSVRYRRDGAERSADIVTQPFAALPFSVGGNRDFDFEIFGTADMDRMVERMPFLPALMQRRTWRGLELVELNADLGRYFGTDKGLLVVRAPDEQRLALQAGDVVQTIGGASPRSVPDAMRLLGFYQPGDKVAVEILRDKRGKTLEMVVPDPGA